MRKGTHFVNVNSDGTSRLTPLVRNRPQVDLLARIRPKCPGCRHCRPSEPDPAHAAAVARQAAAELARRRAARFNFVRDGCDGRPSLLDP
jgi:hypothetical protein